MLCVRHFLKVGGWFKQQKQNVWVVLQVACLVLVFPAFLYGNAFAWMRSTCTSICRPIQKSDKRDQLEAICTIQIGFQWEMDFLAQCRSFIIFLSLRFYVKSVLENSDGQKLPFLPFLGLCILLIWSISACKNCKKSLKSKFRDSKCVKMAVFALLDSILNIDFT